ncbi:MAG: radical SAM protein [Bacilli bacterium]|nr:radical SAM protein [Bacilli bacterium]
MKEFTGNKVIIMCCSNCNLSCKHCYISYKGNFEPNKLLKIVKQLKEKYIISLNGAEVLTNLEYLKSYQEIGQKYILSNGLLIYQNPQIIEKLINYGLKSVSISYHFGIHDKISLIPSKILENVFQLLKSNEFNFRLMTTITSQNYNMIEEICKKSLDLGAKGIYFTNFILQGNALNIIDKNLILNENQIRIFFEQLIKCREQYDINQLLIERDAGFGKNPISSHDNFKCPSINNQVILTPDNNIYPCIFLAKKGYEIGKYIDGKIFINDEYYNINNGNICYAKEICNKGKKLIKK